MPNATRQARREAGAERTLYAVACKRLLDAVCWESLWHYTQELPVLGLGGL